MGEPLIKTYKIHLIRTGKTAGRSGRYVGQLDAPLCGEGEEALRQMAGELVYPPVEKVFASPLSRCVRTAEILYPGAGIIKLDGLMDMNLGEFEGRTFEELRGDADFARWLENSAENAPPGGEDVLTFTRRIVEAVGDVFSMMMDGKITEAAVVTHGGVIMTLLAAIGFPRMPLNEWATGNGEGYTLFLTPQMWMRDGMAEVFCRQPGKPLEDEDEYGGEPEDYS